MKATRGYCHQGQLPVCTTSVEALNIIDGHHHLLSQALRHFEGNTVVMTIGHTYSKLLGPHGLSVICNLPYNAYQVLHPEAERPKRPEYI